jgi:hypothetical protein
MVKTGRGLPLAVGNRAGSQKGPRLRRTLTVTKATNSAVERNAFWTVLSEVRVCSPSDLFNQ